MRRYVTKGYITGLILSILVLFTLGLSQFHHFRSPGVLNTGHEELECKECHESAEGSIRQQTQANLNYLLGFRSTQVTFNYEIPDSKDCLACHDRENDNHPIYRFNEPRFAEVRARIQPQHCVSCHKEHSGVRVTSDPENCKHCHEETVLKEDPIDTSHELLIKDNKWDTCLKCHDFHGNHEMEIPNKLSDMLNAHQIKDFFEGGKDPYSLDKTYKAKESRYENKSH